MKTNTQQKRVMNNGKGNRINSKSNRKRSDRKDKEQWLKM